MLEAKASFAVGGLSCSHASSWLRQVKIFRNSMNGSERSITDEICLEETREGSERFRAVLSSCNVSSKPSDSQIRYLENLL